MVTSTPVVVVAGPEPQTPSPAGTHPTTVAGKLPGTFTVSRTGAAMYEIPIEVPPGLRD